MKVFQILKSITGFDKATRTLTDVQRITELFKAQQYSNLFAFFDAIKDYLPNIPTDTE